MMKKINFTAPAVMALCLLAGVISQAADTAKFLEWAPTPPMGWNSYDCYSYRVNEKQVRENAGYMAAHLKEFGWQYVVVDYVWSAPELAEAGFAPPQSATFEPRLNMDSNGRLLPDEARFPSAANGVGFKALADDIHSKGLKFGIHIMRGIPKQAVAAKNQVAKSDATADQVADMGNPCPWLNHMVGLQMQKPGAQAYLNSLMDLYASWGVDFIKVDDLSTPYDREEVEGYRKAIDQCGRPIVLSLSPGPTPANQAEHVSSHANMWRLLGDLWDQWPQVRSAFDVLHQWEPQIGGGHWPDPDMLPLGRLRVGGPPTGPKGTNLLTHDEQRTLMTLWCIGRCPLMFGGNLPDTDAFTLGLLTNPEVLSVNRASARNRQLFLKNGQAAWSADVPGSSAKYLALFSVGGDELTPDGAAWSSSVVSRQTPGHAVDVNVDIAGAKELYLVAGQGGDDFTCDHADWVEPRLIGPKGVLKLTELRWRSASCGWGTVAVGRSAAGSPLMLDGKRVTDGIGTHAASVIVYDLPEGYTHFQARAGLDDSGTRQEIGGATVNFMVFTHRPASMENQPVRVALSDLGFSGECTVRDLWQRKDLGAIRGALEKALPEHGSGLYLIQSK
ncbi:MAG: NPCBM/NEW2 domain-containing protein [Verrucomicrobiota bacterium]